ncbi:MAG: BREX-1 system phosphatase PglZ type B [Acidimicrobiales bacterium]
MSDTVIDRVVACLTAALEYNRDAVVAPVALLWPDEDAQWVPAMGRVGERMPVVILGEFDPAAKRGPAYWIRCVVARTLDAGLGEATPVVYLPGVSRSQLRAVEDCPSHLAPLAELQYRAQWFSNPHDRDWTVRALLADREHGLGLTVGRDTETNRTLLDALDRLLDQPVDRLATRTLDAAFFRDLIEPDPVGSLIGWLDDQASLRARLDPTQWTAFVQTCKTDYAFDPNGSGEVTGARKLAQRQGKWALVWDRFAQAPEHYPGVYGLLARTGPGRLIIEDADCWPEVNTCAEDGLRPRLAAFQALTPDKARSEVALLDAEHSPRRSTVWAKLDKAPLAFALEQLTSLALLTAYPLASGDLAQLVADYETRGWRADDAAVRALAAVDTAADWSGVSSAVLAMYRSWLEAGAKAFLSLIGPLAGGYRAGPPASTSPGTVTVFVDGLRLDVAHRLADRLVGAGLGVDLRSSLAALPTVTHTAKAALVPVADAALHAGPKLCAANCNGTAAEIDVLRSLMAANGVQVLLGSDTGDPSGTGWTEAGTLDESGHRTGARIAQFLDKEVEGLAGRIRGLLAAGWARVDVVTDHGWILLPGGMEKVELPVATTVAGAKKGRCARLKSGASVEVPTVAWFWDPNVRIAIAPGITCFEANQTYEHGGVSPQECIVPRMTVTLGDASRAVGRPEISSVKWLNLLCRVEVDGVGDPVTVDLRAMPGDPRTSIAEAPQEAPAAGRVSLIVPDEAHQGEGAFLVLVGAGGQVLAQREVRVGSNR